MIEPDRSAFDVPEDVRRLRRQGWSVKRKEPKLTQRQRQERAVANRQRQERAVANRQRRRRAPVPLTPFHEWMRKLPPRFFELEGYANIALAQYIIEHKRTIRTGPNVPSFIRALFEEKKRRAGGQ